MSFVIVLTGVGSKMSCFQDFFTQSLNQTSWGQLC